MFEYQSTIFHFGISHKSSPIGLREQFCHNNQSFVEALKNVKVLYDIKEIFAIQTCHRREIYLVLNNDKSTQSSSTDIKKLLLSIFAKLYQIDKSQHDPSIELLNHQRILFELNDHCYYGTNSLSIAHLMKVVSSIDSIIIGETQITSQFKSALNISEQAGCLGPVLKRLAQVTLATSKKIRHHTSVGEKSLSIASVCFKLAKKHLKTLDNTNVLIIGAGQMAKLCVQYGQRLKPAEIALVNRSPDNARELLSYYPRLKVYGLSSLEDLIIKADVVICTTSSSFYVIHFDHIVKSIEKRCSLGNCKDLFLCDLSMPRNVDPRINQIKGVNLTDIDDLKLVTGSNYKSRKKQADDKAMPIISKACDEFNAWLKDYSYFPLIAKFHQNISSLISKEIEKTANKSVFCQDHSSHFQGLSKALSQKLTSSFAQTIKHNADTNTGDYILAQINNINPKHLEKISCYPSHQHSKISSKRA